MIGVDKQPQGCLDAVIVWYRQSASELSGCIDCLDAMTGVDKQCCLVAVIGVDEQLQRCLDAVIAWCRQAVSELSGSGCSNCLM